MNLYYFIIYTSSLINGEVQTVVYRPIPLDDLELMMDIAKEDTTVLSAAYQQIQKTTEKNPHPQMKFK